MHELTRLNQSVSRIPWAIMAMGSFLGSVMLLAIGQTAFSLIAFTLSLICGPGCSCEDESLKRDWVQDHTRSKFTVPIHNNTCTTMVPPHNK